MIKKTAWLVILFCLSASAAEVLVLEDFESFKVGDTPSRGWRSRDGSAKGIYSIESEAQQKFLRAKYTNKSIQLFKEAGWKIGPTPWLTWKWRVHEFPLGADERDRTKNDSAAGVYVVFPGSWFIPRVIKYVWSVSVPVETVIKHDDRFPIVVIRSGEAGKGQWMSEKRNVLADFRMLFKSDPDNPKALGFLSDGNSMKLPVLADYDEFKVTSDPVAISSSKP